MTEKKTPDDRWFDVLTGQAEPGNRDEEIAEALRQRVLEDAAAHESGLSDLDLQRGKRRLRAAMRPEAASGRPPFFVGMAAGIFAAVLGLSVLNTRIDDGYIDKGLPDLLTPTVERTLDASTDVNALYALAQALTASGIDHVLLRDGDAVTLQFKTPAPVPENVAAQLAALNLPVQTATRYTLVR